MAHFKLNSQTRIITGNQCRKLRRSGFIPAVIFGNNSESQIVQVLAGDFYKIYKESGKTNVIDLKIDENKTLPVIVHSLDVDPVKNLARHIDFLLVNLKQKIHAQVPLVFVGDPVGVKSVGGVLVTSLDSIDVEALPDDIPSEIEVNVEKLAEIGDMISISDIVTTDKYVIINDPMLGVAVLTAQSTEEDFASEDTALESLQSDSETTEATNDKAKNE
jgi:large subunit ribosomal protein L25